MTISLFSTLPLISGGYLPETCWVSGKNEKSGGPLEK
jgi:hypothetical protein